MLRMRSCLTRLQLNWGVIPQHTSMLNSADRESIHKYCTVNRELLERSERAGCFYCEQIFAPSEISEWVDGPYIETGSMDDGVTALCPRCGIDAVLPSAAPIPLNAGLLADMRQAWFGGMSRQPDRAV